MESLLKAFCEAPENRLNVLVELVSILRPADPSDNEKANKNLLELITLLSQNTGLKNEFSGQLANFISQLNTCQILTENGILPPTAFQKEFKNRIGRRILPQLLEKESLEYVFDKLFTQRSDGIWLNGLDQNLLHDLVELLWSNAGPETEESLDIQLTKLPEVLSAVGQKWRKSKREFFVPVKEKSL